MLDLNLEPHLELLQGRSEIVLDETKGGKPSEEETSGADAGTLF